MRTKNLFLRMAVLLLLGVAPVSCNKEKEGVRTVSVTLSGGVTAPNAAGDAAYDFFRTGYAGYFSSLGDHGAVQMTGNTPGTLGGSIRVNPYAARLWCFSIGALGETPTANVPAVLTRSAAASEADLDKMVYCSEPISLDGDGPFAGTLKPLTGAIVLEIMDTGGKWAGKPFSTVTVTADKGKALAGDVVLCLEDARVGELKNESASLTFNCSSLSVGTAEAPATLGAVVLPCAFTGTIAVEAEQFSATLSVDQPLYLQAGYVKHIQVDLAMAEVTSKIVKHFPYRLGILGDSISTFGGIIPSSHRAYYPTTNAVCADVDAWTKTYWGHLINDYWHCELDVNSSWSGSCVAAGDPTVVRTPFVERLDLFKNPDTIILFGGTNDCQPARQIALGEFDYTSAPEALNKYARFRESYIWVIRTLQAKFPEAQIICILGNHIDGEYGNSVKEIATHFGLPLIDFRGDTQVTVYSELHPNAAGHAHMAERIYNETLHLFQ